MTSNVVGPERVESLRRRRALDERVGLLASQIHALEAELAGVLGEFDEAQGWQGGGYRSYAHWVSVRTKFALRDAQRLVSVAQRVESLPTLMADARSGQVSLGVLASAARVVTPENEARVAEVVRVCTPTQAQRVLGTYRAVREHPGETEDPVDERDADFWWRNWIDDRGRYRLDGALDRITGELLEQARMAAATPGAGTPGAGTPGAGTPGAGTPDDGAHGSGAPGVGAPRGGAALGNPAAPRRPSVAEVIAAMASAMLEHASSAGVRDRGGERFGVQVVVDIETLAAALGLDLDRNRPVRIGARAYLPRTGAFLSDAELVRMACEGTVPRRGSSAASNAAHFAIGRAEGPRAASSRDAQQRGSSRRITSSNRVTAARPISTTGRCCARSITASSTAVAGASRYVARSSRSTTARGASVRAALRVAAPGRTAASG